MILDVEQLKLEHASGLTKTELAAKHQTTTYTINKYLNPEYRVKYDAYRKEWRAKRVAAAKALRAGEAAA